MGMSGAYDAQLKMDSAKPFAERSGPLVAATQQTSQSSLPCDQPPKVCSDPRRTIRQRASDVTAASSHEVGPNRSTDLSLLRAGASGKNAGKLLAGYVETAQ